jgi:hypothetical protein
LKKGDNLHHFNIIENGTEKEIKKTCSKILSFESQANPNYFYKKYDTFLIDDARELTLIQNRKHKVGESAIFVLQCGSINVAAQNALLKIFEEARTGTYYFLLLPQSNILLPTFLSRAVVFSGDFESIENSNAVSGQFEFPNYTELNAMPIAERMKLVTKWLDQYKKEKIQKSDMKNFLNSLKKEIHQEALENKDLISKLDEINKVSENFDINGAHLKSILEFVVLVV